MERNYSVPREKVFAAFADPAIKRRWFVEGGGHLIEQYELDFRVGGSEQLRFRFKEGTPLQGILCENQSQIQDIVPGRRIVFAAAMSVGGKRISASLATVEFLESDASAGAAKTDLILTFQGAFFEGADGPEMRQAGWRTLFDRLMGELAK